VKSRTKRSNGISESKVQRISVSLPEAVFCELDQLVGERGWESRSQAISLMVTQAALEHREDKGDTLMAGTITIVYDESKGNLLKRLAELRMEGTKQEAAHNRYKLIEEKSSSMEKAQP
jgi:CopG family nickel-responsive transcriptional regulator